MFQYSEHIEHVEYFEYLEYPLPTPVALEAKFAIWTKVLRNAWAAVPIEAYPDNSTAHYKHD